MNSSLQQITDKIISLNYLNASQTNLAAVQNLTLEIENELSKFLLN